jgi:hypothetical protein
LVLDLERELSQGWTIESQLNVMAARLQTLFFKA